ncbi:MAG: thymidine phosphorylase [Mycoplasma sp.]
MNILEIIEKKKNNIELSEKEIFFFVDEYLKENLVKDYQASSLLMAMRINGLSIKETSYLTKAFIDTSKKLNFKIEDKNSPSIDKHSSGGVGDKVSLILLPILTCFGIKVPKISGRGLGHTGGTIDKLESINVNTEIDFEKANEILNEVGCVIMSQTDDLLPADKKIYALRDVTGTVDSQGLITSSILSKKFIVNTDHIFIDLKVGSGAILNDLSEARDLAYSFIEIAKLMERELTVTITSMDKPLGKCIGNILEVKESIDFLKNKNVASDLEQIIFFFVSDILLTTKKAKTIDESYAMIKDVLTNNKAYEAFEKWISSQGGDIGLVDKWSPKHKIEIVAKEDGFVDYISTHEIGMISVLLGAGRLTKQDTIDNDAGIILNKQFNDETKKGEIVATLYSNKPISNELKEKFEKNMSISKDRHISKQSILAKFTTNDLN